MISLLPACYKACACPSVNLECPPCLPSLLCLPSITFARPAYPACRACCGLFVVLTPPVEAHLPMTHMLRSTYEPRSSLTKPLCAKPAYADTARHGPPSKYVILDAMMCANKVRQKMARTAPWHDMFPMSAPSLLPVCLAHGIEHLFARELQNTNPIRLRLWKRIKALRAFPNRTRYAQKCCIHSAHKESGEGTSSSVLLSGYHLNPDNASPLPKSFQLSLLQTPSCHKA